MNEGVLLKQAQELATVLPSVMRQLFAVEDDPAAEMPLAQLRVCVLLADGPRPMSAISRKLGITLSAMTQLADRLERAGMVTRVAEGSDRRVRQLQLTPQAEQVLRFREDVRLRRLVAVLRQLSPRERSDVLAVLERLKAACTVLLGDPVADEDSVVAEAR